MCGICGEVIWKGGPASASRIERMADTMAPRGPDGAGVLTRGAIGFGHRRLKIIDLSRCRRPALRRPADGAHDGLQRLHLQLPRAARRARGQGPRLLSTSDTEVIIKAWAEWGPVLRRAVLRHVRLRHPRPQRPAGWRWCATASGSSRSTTPRPARALRFASTLPALLAGGGIDTSIDRVALHHYMTWHAVVPPPRTILAGVRKLPPATMRIYEPDGTYRDTSSGAELRAEPRGRRALAWRNGPSSCSTACAGR
jgi:asparagine synthase (glutamine-hydrolysing)